MIDYYTRIAPVMLRTSPAARSRSTYPNGVAGKHFYEKQCPRQRPDWATATIRARGRGRFGEPASAAPRDIDFCLVQDRPTLVWLANLASLELHVAVARASEIARPRRSSSTSIPGRRPACSSAPASRCCCATPSAPSGLAAVVKTSGLKGLQVDCR